MADDLILLSLSDWDELNRSLFPRIPELLGDLSYHYYSEKSELFVGISLAHIRQVVSEAKKRGVLAGTEAERRVFALIGA